MKSAIFTLASLTALSLTLSPCAMAHPETETPKKEAPKSSAKAPTDIKDIKLPSAAEIKAMHAQMPDMNALMGGMMEIMKDEKLQSSLRSASKTMAKKMGDVDMSKGENGLPDMNAMMGAMLSMMSDEEGMGAMLSALKPLAIEMEALAKEAAPQTPKSESPN